MVIITKSYSSRLLNNYYVQIMFLIENKDALSCQSSSLGRTNRIAKTFWYFQSVRYRRERARHQPCSGENGCGSVGSTLPLGVIPLPARPPQHSVPKPRWFSFPQMCAAPSTSPWPQSWFPAGLRDGDVMDKLWHGCRRVVCLSGELWGYGSSVPKMPGIRGS